MVTKWYLVHRKSCRYSHWPAVNHQGSCCRWRAPFRRIQDPAFALRIRGQDVFQIWILTHIATWPPGRTKFQKSWRRFSSIVKKKCWWLKKKKWKIWKYRLYRQWKTDLAEINWIRACKPRNWRIRSRLCSSQTRASFEISSLRFKSTVFCTERQLMSSNLRWGKAKKSSNCGRIRKWGGIWKLIRTWPNISFRSSSRPMRASKQTRRAKSHQPRRSSRNKKRKWPTRTFPDKSWNLCHKYGWTRNSSKQMKTWAKPPNGPSSEIDGRRWLRGIWRWRGAICRNRNCWRSSSSNNCWSISSIFSR